MSCVLSFVDDVRVIKSFLTDLHFDKINSFRPSSSDTRLVCGDEKPLSKV